MRICAGNNPADTKVSDTGQRAGVPGARWEIPLLWWRPWWNRLSLCSPWSPWRSRYPSVGCGRSHVRADGCLKKAVTLWKAHTGVDSQQDLWPCEERSTHWSWVAGRSLRGTHGGEVHEGKDAGWRTSGRTISYGRDPTLEWRKGVRSPSLEDKGVAGTDDELTDD